jgi:hypothetical protein
MLSSQALWIGNDGALDCESIQLSWMDAPTGIHQVVGPIVPACDHYSGSKCAAKASCQCESIHLSGLIHMFTMGYRSAIAIAAIFQICEFRRRWYLNGYRE